MQAHTADHLTKIITNMADKNVMVIGDIMLDRFVYGEVDRISPESPVPILSITREDKMLGGAGNALCSLNGLKTRAVIVSVLGDDAAGDIVRQEIQSLGLSAEGLICDPARPTTVKTRFLAGHQQLLRSDYEKKMPLSPDIADMVLDKIKQLMPTVSVVLVSDYGKGLLGRDVLQEIMKLAGQHNVPVVVDPKGVDYSKYAGAAAVTPNKKELSEATGHMPVKTDQDILQAASKLITECGIANVIATRSADGISVIEGNKLSDPLHLRTAAKAVFDVSGAGDVVIATICGALAAGANMVQAASLANVAGGIAVSKVGTAPIRAKELLDALADSGHAVTAITPVSSAHTISRNFQAPLCDDDEALEQIRRWRARGLKIGFTNGCFDIVHHGHVSYLNEARSKCDRLVIGLNTDLSVSALKGPERPVHDEKARASVLGALASVDMVVLFGGKTAQDDQTAIALLSKLQPDIYFKGGDYKVEDIPEAPCVQKHGGEVLVLSEFAGHSTTNSIAKMRSTAA